MSAMQRYKGRAYEQQIARQLRAAFPAAEVRRSSQADRAGNSDVVVTGSAVLGRLWLELQDARRPTPGAKLTQAERDIARGSPVGRLPVVIWHRIREQGHQVTTRLWVLDVLRFGLERSSHVPFADEVVTLDLEEFIGLLLDLEASGAGR